jgi:hypothetical protein
MERPRLRRPGPRTSSDVVEVAGLGCLDGAAWWWHPIVGLVVTGLILLFVGWVMGSEPAPPRD